MGISWEFEFSFNAFHAPSLLIYLSRPKQEDSDELDSMMYQTVGHEVIDLYAEAMDLPLFRRDLEGSGLAIDKDYEPTQGDEVEDLFNLLKEVNDK